MLRGRDVLLTERRDHTYILTLNREERLNALSMELMARVDEELQTFDEDDDLWVLILTGKGDKAFCGGLDLKDFSERASSGNAAQKPPAYRKAHSVVPTWKPMIAAVNGFAMAGGWWMAQRCDLRVAADTAMLGITENKWNLPGPFGAEMGVFPTSAVASEIYILAEPVTAERAHQIGFINKVVPASEVMSQALAWAERICVLGQQAVRAHKKSVYYGHFIPPSELAGVTSEFFYWTGGKPGVVIDSSVGARAFVEKRQPNYTDMFYPPRFECTKCGAIYVTAKVTGGGPVTCCGLEVVDSPAHP